MNAKKNFLSLLALSGFFLMATGLFAQTVTLGQETASGGFIGPLLWPINGMSIASAGNATIQPFGSPVPVTDAIRFISGTNWAFDPNYDQGAWQQIDPNTWILPANDGIESANTVGHWYSISGGYWIFNQRTSPYQRYVVLDELGDLSVVVTFINNGPNGVAAINYASGPNVPEPSTLLLLGIGAISLLGYRKAGSR